MNHNPNECDIVQDLLPLYYDHACSPASCELVRQHLADCADCEKIYEDLANHTIDNVIETESREILERHAKKERNLAYKAGIVIAALLLVPILITFIAVSYTHLDVYKRQLIDGCTLFFKFFFVCRLKIRPVPFKQFFICFIGFLSSAEFTGRICKNIFISRHLQTLSLIHI